MAPIGTARVHTLPRRFAITATPVRILLIDLVASQYFWKHIRRDDETILGYAPSKTLDDCLRGLRVFVYFCSARRSKRIDQRKSWDITIPFDVMESTHLWTATAARSEVSRLLIQTARRLAGIDWLFVQKCHLARVYRRCPLGGGRGRWCFDFWHWPLRQFEVVSLLAAKRLVN